MIKVLFVLQDNFDDNKGGMATQMREYMQGMILRNCNVSRVSITEFENGLEEVYDIIHLCDVSIPFDIKKMINGVKKIDRKRTKIVLSTIYWDFEDYFKNGSYFFQKVTYRLFGGGNMERISSLIKYLTTFERRYLNGFLINKQKLQKEIGSVVDLLLPNSKKEGELFQQKTGVTTNYKVIFNGVSLKNNLRTLKKDIDLLCVARIDRRKNQMQIAKEFENTEYKVVFVGPIGPNSKNYFVKLNDIISKNSNMEYLGVKSRNELDELYLRSKYHCLLSWIETPGLVNLDAFSLGCEVIVSDKGSVKEYLLDAAHYVKISSKKGDLISVLNSQTKISSIKRNTMLNRIRDTYNWDTICDDLFLTYTNLLNYDKLG